MPVWAYTAVTDPLGDRLAEAVTYRGAISDTNDIDRFRIVGDNQLMWTSPQTTWEADPKRFAGAIQRRIRKIFPQLGRVAIAAIWSGVYGQTIHGMPQIGQWRPGLWVASGFGRQGLNTSAMAGHLIASAITDKTTAGGCSRPSNSSGRAVRRAVSCSRLSSAGSGSASASKLRYQDTMRSLRFVRSAGKRVPPLPRPPHARPRRRRVRTIPICADLA